MSHAGVAPRYPPERIPSIAGLRLWPTGCAATLVNMSTSGVLAMCTTRVPPGTLVRVLFDGTFSPSSAEGVVARCEVAAIDPDLGMLFHVGIAFAAAIRLDDALTPKASEPPRTLTPSMVRNRW